MLVPETSRTDVDEAPTDSLTILAHRCTIGPLQRHWNRLVGLMRKRIAFALVRFNDGEHLVLSREGMVNIDGIHAEVGRDSVLRHDMLQVLRGHYGEPFFYGIASPRQFPDATKFLVRNIEQTCEYVTFATIFVDGLYINWTRPFLQELLESHCGDLVGVINTKAVVGWKRLESRCFSKMPVIEIPNYNVSSWNGAQRTRIIDEALGLARAVRKKVFLFSGGPVAKVLISLLFREFPQNCYVDFGSALDPFLKLHETRDYQSGARTTIEPVFQAK